MLELIHEERSFPCLMNDCHFYKSLEQQTRIAELPRPPRTVVVRNFFSPSYVK